MAQYKRPNLNPTHASGNGIGGSGSKKRRPNVTAYKPKDHGVTGIASSRQSRGPETGPSLIDETFGAGPVSQMKLRH